MARPALRPALPPPPPPGKPATRPPRTSTTRPSDTDKLCSLQLRPPPPYTLAQMTTATTRLRAPPHPSLAPAAPLPMGKGPRRLRAPASPGGQPGPSPDKPARPPQRTTCGSPRVSHIWRPTQSWSGMLLRRRFVAGPAPRPAPLGTPADEATSTHTGLDDYYYSYYYEPPARRPRLRCHVPWPATTRSPGKPWGPPQLALTSTMTDWAVAPSLAAGHHRAPAAVVCPSRRLQRPRPRARAACWALSSGRRPHPTPSTATTTS